MSTDVHNQQVTTIRRCRETFLAFKMLLDETAHLQLALEKHLEENAGDDDHDEQQDQHGRRRIRQQNAEPEISQRVLYAGISVRVERQEFETFPLTLLLLLFHGAAAAYALGDESLGGMRTLTKMQTSITGLLRSRLHLIMSLLYASASSSDIDNICTTLLGAESSACYFDVRTINKNERHLVSDVALLCADLAAYEIAVSELLFSSNGGDETARKQQITKNDAMLRRLEAFTASLALVERRDEGIQIEANRPAHERNFFSGYAGRATRFVTLWRESSDKFLSRDRIAPKNGENNNNINTKNNKWQQQQQQRRAQEQQPIQFSRSNLFNQLQKGGRIVLPSPSSTAAAASPSGGGLSSVISAAAARNVEIEAQTFLPAHRAVALCHLNSDGDDDDEDDDEILEEGKIRVLPFELIDYCFQFLLPAEIVSVAQTSIVFQRVVVARLPLRRQAQLSLTATRRINWYCQNEWGAKCTVVARDV